ncbi:TPA: hypothetical protein ACJIW3_004491 [Enterobacter hormaechei]
MRNNKPYCVETYCRMRDEGKSISAAMFLAELAYEMKHGVRK